MSGINGDKSRFHRLRKQKLARRKRTLELVQSQTGQRQPATVPSSSKPKTVSA